MVDEQPLWPVDATLAGKTPNTATKKTRMITGLLGFKALTWRPRQHFGSPLEQYNSFIKPTVWRASRIVAATCSFITQPVAAPYQMLDGTRTHNFVVHSAVPDLHCTCGFYVTRKLSAALSYCKEGEGAILLVEGMIGPLAGGHIGRVALHEIGFRASHARVVGILEDATAGEWLARRVAEDFFQVEAISLAVAMEMIETQWRLYTPET